MRNVLAIISLLFFKVAFVQETTPNQGVEFTIEPKPMSKGTQPAFIFNLPGAKLKEIETLWGKYVARGSKEKVQNNKGEWTIIGAVDRNISPSPFFLYATMLETIEGVRLTAFFAEQDVFLAPGTTTDEKILAIKKYLNDFANLVKIEQVKAELETEQKVLKGMEGNMKTFQKEFDKSEKSIAESKRKIEKNEAEIRRTDREIELKNGQIAQQKDVILKLTNALGDEKKVAQKTLKGLEKDKSNLYKQKEKMAKEIDKCKASIRNDERAQDKTTGQKKAAQTEIDKQESKIKSIQEKLAAIPDPGIKL